MGVKDWPAEERPREKLLSLGAEALSDAELLAVLVRSGMPGHTPWANTARMPLVCTASVTVFS